MRGLYIHVPFCVKKCAYCDFYSLPGRQGTLDAYVRAVLEEALLCHSEACSRISGNLKYPKNLVPNSSNTRCFADFTLNNKSPERLSMTGGFQTLYIGGGTPSLLGAENLKKLMDALQSILNPGCHCEERSDVAITELALSKTKGWGIASSQRLLRPDYVGTRNDEKPQGRGDSNNAYIEATIEVNPESATREFLQAAKDTGFNRISFGVQSLYDDELRSVGRIHTAKQAISVIKLAQKTGFQSISADLIIGLPGQTWSSLHSSLDTLAGLGIQHLSVYCLSLEEGTPLAEHPPSNLPSDDAQAELYDKTREFLKKCGFIHYEISNFALPGYECLHNLNYWRGGEYLGLGPSGASHLNGKRFKNKSNLDAYLQNPTGQMEYIEELNAEDKAAEEAMLRLRLLEEGLNTSELASKFGIDNVASIVQRLNSLVKDGLLTQENTTYRLNTSRIMTSNPIFARVLSEVTV